MIFGGCKVEGEGFGADPRFVDGRLFERDVQHDVIFPGNRIACWAERFAGAREFRRPLDENSSGSRIEAAGSLVIGKNLLGHAPLAVPVNRAFRNTATFGDGSQFLFLAQGVVDGLEHVTRQGANAAILHGPKDITPFASLTVRDSREGANKEMPVAL